MERLEECVDFIQVEGREQGVIQDEPLLRWAEARSLTPREAVVRALERGILPLRYVRNLVSLGIAEQLSLCRSRALICGCGGLGGALGSLLARAGVGSIRFVDGDAFTPSNLNRQWFCDTSSIGRNKAETARDRVLRINPLLEVQAFPLRMEASNVKQLLDSVDLALDALDDLPSRFVLFEAAQDMEIPFIHAAVAGWLGQIATFTPNFPAHLSQIYGRHRRRSEAEEALGVLGPTAAVIGSLQSMEALRVLTGKSPAYEGSLLYFDGESGEQALTPLSPLEP